MNVIADLSFTENVKRLALGLEPIDAGRGLRIAHPIRVVFNETVRGLPRPPVDRHDSCLHALLYQPGVADRVTLRFVESGRRFVPRLISYPILTLEDAEGLPYQNRVRRPRLFPGAAYDVASLHTGIRGRVTRGGGAGRWARVTARLPGGGAVVGRAMADDRGEFLLLLQPSASPAGDLTDPLEIRVDVFLPAVAPVPPAADVPAQDPLWDLPVEEAQPLNAADPENDPVSAGEVLPGGFTASTGRDIGIRLGRMHSETNEFTIS
jgi:hypothetical protein